MRGLGKAEISQTRKVNFVPNKTGTVGKLLDAKLEYYSLRRTLLLYNRIKRYSTINVLS